MWRRLAGWLLRPVSLRTYSGKWLAGTAAMTIVLGVVAVLFITLDTAPSYQPKSKPVAAPSAVPSLAGSAASPGASAPTVLARSVPVEVKIPAIGVDARIVPVYDPGGVLQAPPLTGAGASEVGWWAGIQGDPQKSYSPGQAGPAVLVGHVNSSAIGDLVFAHLTSLKAGDTATVILASGQQVTFTFQSMQEISKAEWASGDTLAAQTTREVYGASPVPALRLITCGGSFDPSTGHYRDNIIAYLTEA